MTGIVIRRLVAALLLTLVSQGIAAAQEPEGEDKDAASGKVIAKPNLGGHAGLITCMVEGAEGRRLYTAGRQDEVSEWDVASGERLRVWRFPAPNVALAYSHVGKKLAVATVNPKTVKGSVWLVNLETGEVDREVLVLKGQGCFALAFSADGERLAASRHGGTDVYTLKAKGKPLVLKETGKPRRIAFDKSGRWLLIAGIPARVISGPGDVQLWDLKSESPKPLMLFDARIPDPMAAWSNDGKHVAVVSGGAAPAVSLWSVGEKPKLVWKVDGAALRKALGGEKSVYFPNGISHHHEQGVVASWNMAGRLKLVQVDLKTQLVAPLPTDIQLQREQGGGQTVFVGNQWLAATSDPPFRIALYDLQKHVVIRLLGPNDRVPKVVGWTPDSRGVAWGFTPRPDRDWQKALSAGMDMGKLTHLSREELDGARTSGLPEGWSIESDASGKASLVRKGKKTELKVRGILPGLTRAFQKKDKRLLAVVHQFGVGLCIVNPQSGQVTRILNRQTRVHDLAVSPDQKYLLIAGGGMELMVYPLDHPGGFVMKILAREGGDWVAWTQEGYYAGTPGGEKLMGWKVVAAADRPAMFYPAETFRKKLYRPDVIGKVLETGSVEAALKSLPVKERAVTVETVEDVLPPKVDLQIVQDAKDPTKVVVSVKAESSVAKQPVEMLRLLVDGRPLADGQGVKEVGKGEKPGAKWTIPKLPGGRLELKVLARCPDVCGVSAPKVVIVPLAAKNRPALHVLAVGLNYTGKAGLTLGCAINDAKTLSAALSAACAGKNNLFRQDAPAQQLLEGQATTKGVLDALAALGKKKLKPRDLVVFFYAGHGVREGKEFYLLTHDADLKNLKKTALSGRDLRAALRDMPCQVLVLLDACHSGSAARSLLTDAASRGLTDAECGVTLLAAAMGYEKAEEEGVNGRFTKGLLKALGTAKTLPHNPNDGRQYVHHLYSHVFDDVKTQSAGRQHPFLSLPWTSESFAIRQLTNAVKAAGP